MLVVAALACGGGSNTGQKVGEKAAPPTSAPPKVEVYKVGDVVQVQDHTIVLNEAKIEGDVLKANFTIENKGSKDLAVSSLISFSARDSEGNKLQVKIIDCGTSQLDDKVLPGDKLKGDICWEGATTDSVKIYYEASLLGSSAVVWEVKR
jgi:hypothetical protein